MDDLVERLREMGEHPCRAKLPMGQDLRQAADRIEALQARIAELEVGQAQAMVKGAELMREAAASAIGKVGFDTLMLATPREEALRVIRALSPADVVKATPLTQ